jgi:hypothetical protein
MIHMREQDSMPADELKYPYHIELLRRKIQTNMPSPEEPARNVFESLLKKYTPRIESQWYNNQTFSLDGYTFVGCRFDNCTLYIATGMFSLDHCFFAQCTLWYLDDAYRVIRSYHITEVEGGKKYPSLAPVWHEDGTLSIL